MCKAKILANLKGRTNPVAWHCAIAGLDDYKEASDSLKELISDGKVEKQMMPHGYDKMGRQISFPMYRSVPDFSNINKSHLTVIK